uniref:CobW/HypB/UreG nucleotide-binding domain-containing protein n=1 Tax=Timema genevievae TaxID=629358 RepID=A0A7R9JQD6_TIMGE|nr:unnamed protein product [Timema genevievae]
MWCTRALIRPSTGVLVEGQLLGSDRVPGLNPSHAKENGLLNEAVRQIALADLVIVNKVDLVSPEHVEQLKKEIRLVGDPGFQAGIGEDLGVKGVEGGGVTFSKKTRGKILRRARKLEWGRWNGVSYVGSMIPSLLLFAIEVVRSSGTTHKE